MKNSEKTREQLLKELEKSNKRIVELENSESDRLAAEQAGKKTKKVLLKSEEKIKHINLILNAIRGVNKLIIKEKDKDLLVQKVCDILIETRGYSSAWIVLFDEHEKINIFKEAGLGEDSVLLKKTLECGELIECVKRALKQKEVVLIDNHLSVCAGCPLLEKNPHEKSLTKRLQHNKKTYGIISVSIPLDFVTDEEEQSLFEEVADDISFALYNIELEKENEKSRIALGKRTRDLNDRLKEIYCLYGIDEIITLPGITYQEVFNETTQLIQSNWQYPEITAVKITYDGTDYQSYNFKKTKWLLQVDLILDMKKTGSIEVYYLEEKPDIFDGPFLEEEIHLLQRIANSLVKFIKQQEVNNELIKAKEKAEESDRLKSSFLSNMSHEIRTPLNAIVGFGDMLGNDDIADEDKVKFVPIIRENTNQLLHLIDDILDLSKMESNQLKIFKKECRVDKVLGYMADVFNNQKISLGKNEIDIRLKTEKRINELSIHTDPVRLQQVLNNLISNALKYTESGYIEIGYSIETGKEKIKNRLVQFYVKDTGIGISEKGQEIIFNRFTKIEDDKTKLYRGAGLGLAISKKLVNMLGGEMWVESTPGKNSSFYFTIPTGEVDMAKTKTGPAKKVQDTVGSYNWSGKSILVAEDDESNFKLIKIILQRTKANITHVTNGEDAVEAIKSNSIDLVLMDIKMPQMDGISATKIIKKIKKELPVIAVTAYAREEEQEECRLAGCDEIVVKPLNVEKLFTTLSKYI